LGLRESCVRKAKNAGIQADALEQKYEDGEVGCFVVSSGDDGWLR